MAAHPNLDGFDSKEFSCPKSGIRKEVIHVNFTSMTKPTELSKCYVNISHVEHLGDRETNYLNKSESFWMQLGTAVTPVDYYTELLCQQMFAGETSRCFIQTKSEDEIRFTIKILDIEFKKYLFQLSVAEMYELALQYKQNGVTMFKKYPKFAQNYFCRAAKCLISYQPFEVLDKDCERIDPNDMKSLFENLQTNIAACLVKENRNEDVLHVTEFAERNDVDVSDKAVYRRALALNNLRQYDEAKNLLEKHNFAENKDLNHLYSRIMKEWKQSDKRYGMMVKKMFR